MGCGGSKESEKDKRKIKHSFDKTMIPSYDEFFTKAEAVLKSCEELRHGV